MARGRRSPVALLFGALWLVLWGAGMLAAAALLLSSLRGGEWQVALILLLWLAVATFVLVRMGRGFARGLTGGGRIGPASRPRRKAHRWQDGMPGGSAR